MQLVMLAAGKGTRFGGLKQIAPVGPQGEAIMDFTARAAERAGFEEVVVVVRAEASEAISEHIARWWPAALPVATVVQAEHQAGTVPAVLAAAPVLRGPFGVVNADDLYDAAVLGQLHDELVRIAAGGPEAPHVLVCYDLVRTILTADPVKRGLCVEAADGTLADLVEHHVRLRPDGRFDAWPLDGGRPGAPPSRILAGHEPVSMNLWGFHPRVLDDFVAALDAPSTGEILLPEVLGALTRQRGERVRCCRTGSRCVGITHRDDLVPLREQLSSLGVLDGLRP